MNVLIADDDQVQTMMLAKKLKARGCKVSTAGDAIQAWTTAARTMPDVIILDIQMPGGTGVAVLRQLKSSANTNQIPVIVVSGSVDPKASDRVKSLGADDFLRKPVDLHLLLDCMDQVTDAAGKTPAVAN